jgi:hypothetical protein
MAVIISESSILYEYEKAVDVERLHAEILDSDIITAIDYITFNAPEDTNIYFKDTLSSGDETILDGIVEDHENTPITKSTLVHLDSPADTDGVPIQRIKASNSGWIYNLIPIEFTTSDLDSVCSKHADGTNRAGITLKLYDDQDDEITSAENESDTVKTVVDFEPTYNYEIIGGSCRQMDTPTSAIRVWVVAIPDVPSANGGSIEMIGGINLQYIDPADKVDADGRAATFMAYNATYHTNKMRIILTHPAGTNHNLMVLLETFKNKITS